MTISKKAPGEKLAELCDADYRTTHPGTAAVAMAIPVRDGGVTMPDPYRDREQREHVLGLVRAHLEAQPSPKAVRAAALRLTAAITSLASDLAKERYR